MQLGTSVELDVLRYSIIAGCAMGVIYDLFSVIRRTLDKNAVTFVCDLLYVMMFSAAFFTVSLSQTHYLRGFVLAGMLAGAAMWCFTIGRPVVWLLVEILKFISDKIILVMFVLIYKMCKRIKRKFVKNDINFEESKKIPENT